MSRASFERGLKDGASGARPIMQDADYDRGYHLGAADVRTRLAMYDLEQRQKANHDAWRERIDKLIARVP